MNVSDENARESLCIIRDMSAQSRGVVEGIYASPILILWGLVTIIAFLGSHFFMRWAGYIWTVLPGAGALGTFLICRWQFRAGVPTKIPNAKKVGWQIFLFWSLLFVYVFIWLSILAPYNGLQCNAFIVTAVMFAYVIIGLFEKTRFMLLLGLAVTATTLAGVYLIDHHYYCLWMAATCGGALFGTGLYLRLRWR